MAQSACDGVDGYPGGEKSGGGEVTQVMEPHACDTNFAAEMNVS